MNIQNTAKRPTSPHPILNLGFRIFFVGSAVFAVISMLLWLVILQGFAPFQGVVTPFYWHGHEMVFGYALAVIAGFFINGSQNMDKSAHALWLAFGGDIWGVGGISLYLVWASCHT